MIWVYLIALVCLASLMSWRTFKGGSYRRLDIWVRFLVWGGFAMLILVGLTRMPEWLAVAAATLYGIVSAAYMMWLLFNPVRSDAHE
jgi:hypothetical protein